MDRNGFLAVFLLFLIVPNVSDASFVGQFRKLLDAAPKDNSADNSTKTGISSPVPDGKESKPKPTNANKSSEVESKGTQVPNNSSKPDPKGSDNKGSGNSSTGNQKDSQNNHQENGKNDNLTNTEAGTVGNCDGLPNKCKDQKMVVCIRRFGNDSKEVALLVQNKGESALNVNLTVLTYAKNDRKEELEILKHQTKGINISLTVERIVLNASNGDCVIHMDSPVSEGYISPRFPSYSKLVTPIYGAYFLFLTALIVGGSWACCKFRKKRRQLGGVPYQELEMGLPASVSSVDVETAEGWDQGWDDDWDEDKAVKSPGGCHVVNISGNGLTSRSSNKDGWEHDWDD